ncbi:MAG: hypothetical protein A2681_02670 [Candidatus Liptonbacteria bacterium RIFCSPHIGHO2_01_FULL_56_18b]|nr:MAG: N-acetylglucosamine kinase [Parcubacteria group bacterium GW2011_GWB1_56_8]OGY98109.1 MAG: hypothetical protein A2681_02670 [Candidatus Liptonbacteria bacterium RIFCSPHIGHO2_01_FULL_56_18b]
MKNLGQVIGIDIGGSKIRGVLWNGTRVLRTTELPTPGNTEGLIAVLAALVSRLHAPRVSRIGIGAAGTVKGTVLRSCTNIRYVKNLDLKRPFPRAALRLDNDARCFGRAEFLLGAGRRANGVFALTLGTGIGRAYGAHARIRKAGRFEYAESWEKAYQKLRGEKLVAFLSNKLPKLLQPFNPKVLVIGGGVLAHKGFFEKLRAALRKKGVRFAIRRAKLGRNAVAIGAALLFRR